MTKKHNGSQRVSGRRGRRDIPLENDAMFDPFEKGLARYTFRSICEEDGDLSLGDGRCIMFLNTKGSIGELGSDMDAFFGYINGGVSSIGTGKDSGSEFVERLDECVLDINGDEDWRQGYMKYELNLIEKYKDGEAKGISIGEANATNRMVKSFKEQGFPIEAIAKAANLSIEEVNRIN